ncbi:MAG: 23S rRNA (guanosine(2251)-2'-O)-methyltransferase RlmB [bacterium]
MEDQKELVYGRNSVEGALKLSKRNITKLILAKGIKIDPKMKSIIDSARAKKIVILEVPKEKLDVLTEKANHQGIAVYIAPIEYADLDEVLENLKNKEGYSTIAVLDSVEDPHNLGAIIRTSAAAAVDAVIIPKRRSAAVNSSVEKASAGTIDRVPIVQVTNISQAIEKLKEHNFWVVGADADAKQYHFDVKYDMNTAFVLGGENKGISSLVRKNCDIIVKIPMPGSINSLNVSNAYSVIVYEAVRQRLVKTKP